MSVKGVRRQRIGIRDRRRGDAGAWQARLPSYPRRPLIRRNNLDKRRGAVAHMPVWQKRTTRTKNQKQTNAILYQGPLSTLTLNQELATTRARDGETVS